jgi:hypothetical protein
LHFPLNYNQFSVLRANTYQFFTFIFKIVKTFKVCTQDGELIVIQSFCLSVSLSLILLSLTLSHVVPQLRIVSNTRYLTQYLKHSLCYSVTDTTLCTVVVTLYLTHSLNHALPQALAVLQCHSRYLTYCRKLFTLRTISITLLIRYFPYSFHKSLIISMALSFIFQVLTPLYICSLSESPALSCNR